MSMSAPQRTGSRDRQTDAGYDTGSRTVVSTNEARQAVTGHQVRWVLGAGLAAIVFAFAVLYVIFFVA